MSKEWKLAKVVPAISSVTNPPERTTRVDVVRTYRLDEIMDACSTGWPIDATEYYETSEPCPVAKHQHNLYVPANAVQIIE